MFAKAGLEANHYPENAGGTVLVRYSLHMTSANIQSNVWMLGSLWEADHETIGPMCTFEINVTEDSTI